MQKDQAAFAAEVAAIAHELNLPSSPGAILDLARATNDRVQKANAAQASRTAKEQSLESARERQRALAETLVSEATYAAFKPAQWPLPATGEQQDSRFLARADFSRRTGRRASSRRRSDLQQEKPAGANKFVVLAMRCSSLPID